MGKVKTTWLLPGHSGRPCHHEDIYTKMNKKTGQVYSVKLCYPSEKVTANQVAQRNSFGLVSMALSAWIRQNKVATATDHAAYMAVKAQYDRQTKYSTLRGYMMAKNMATVQTDGSVVITIGSYTTTVTGSVVDDGTGGSGNENQNPGENQGTGEGSGNTPAAKKTVTLSVTPSGSGTVTGGGQYDEGATATLKATAASGFHFVKWSDHYTSATRTMVVSSDITLQAIFAADTPQGGGDDGGGSNEGDDI